MENGYADGNQVVKNAAEANKILKEHNYKVQNGEVDSFVSLQGINKVYPNGVQAVYDFNLDINKHDFIVLVGPSGCGKSTTLRMVAGLEEISSGYLYIDKVLSNYLPSKSRDISMVFQSYALYPQMSVYENIAFPLKIRKYTKRKVGKEALGYKLAIKAFENTELLARAIVEGFDKTVSFGKPHEYISTLLNISDEASKVLLSLNIPHNSIEIALDYINANKEHFTVDLDSKLSLEEQKLTAAGYEFNENYELSLNGEPVFVNERLSKEEIRRKVFDAARILDLGPYLDRLPKELSGGQMQRVALGRAIVRNAKVFLMDEPLSNLDAKLRVLMRSEIVRIHEHIGATTIYVTHDQTEAMTMATRIVVMSKGWVQQVGTPHEVYSDPANLFVATFIGSPAMNIFDGTLDKNEVTLSDGFSVDLAKDFKEKDKAFYERKVAETTRLINLLDNEREFQAIRVFEPLYKALKNNKVEVSKLGPEIAKSEFERLHHLVSSLEVEINAYLDGAEIANKHEFKQLIKTKIAELNSLIKAKVLEAVETKLDEINELVIPYVGEEFVSSTKAQLVEEFKKAVANEEFDLDVSKENYVEAQLDRLIALFENHKKENKEEIIASLKEVKEALGTEALLPSLELAHEALNNILTITEADLSKIYSAQSYIEGDVKSQAVMTFGKKTKVGKKVKKVKKHKAIDPRETKILLEGMLKSYEEALKGPHTVKVGIRPEHIHLDSEYTKPSKSKPFVITPNVVELLGGELLIHAEYNNIDLIAKIPATTIVKSHEEVKLVLNKESVLIFDPISGERIK
jgi:ABC-type sugar transport system ATPase subunit